MKKYVSRKASQFIEKEKKRMVKRCIYKKMFLKKYFWKAETSGYKQK